MSALDKVLAFGIGTLIFGAGALVSHAVEQDSLPERKVQVAEQRQSLDAHEVLLHVLPFYRVETPRWCQEDMACWIGSAADGRSDTELLAAIRDDLAYSSWAYSEEGEK